MGPTDPRANAKQDANQVYTIIGVRGTLGDSDTGGTALPMKFSGNPDTGAQYVEQIGGTNVNIVGGTFTGTVVSGTVQINKTPVQIGTPFVVQGTTGASVWGTIIPASGAGTKQYISRVSIIVVSGTVDVAVTNIGVGGSTGAGVLERGNFVPSAGITNNYDPVIPSGTNGTIAYWLGGAGTVDIAINYWQGP